MSVEPASKKPCPPSPVLTDLSTYSISQLLGQSDDGRTVFTLGEIKDKDGQAIVLFESSSIDLDKVKQLLDPKSKLALKMNNDIFSIFAVEAPPGVNTLKTTIMYPATDKLINKFTQKPSYFVTETPKTYEEITKPYILDHLSDLGWVYNILEGKSEVDRIMVSDPDPVDGFKLAADLKWDMTTVENLYCLAIVNRRDLYSVRTLDASHLPLLESIQEKCQAYITAKYNVPSSLIRSYLHYQPAYYHLHVHFSHIRNHIGAPIIGKSLALDEVIENIKLCPDYYQQRTMRFYLKDGHALSNEYDKHGLIQREVVSDKTSGV